jgi:hypothetical protein
VPGPRTGGLLAVIPLIFTSSTVVPVATFPGWLQAFAKVSRSPSLPAHCGC